MRFKPLPEEEDPAAGTRRPHWHLLRVGPVASDPPEYGPVMGEAAAGEAAENTARELAQEGYKVYACGTVFLPAEPNGAELLLYPVACQRRGCLAKEDRKGEA